MKITVITAIEITVIIKLRINKNICFVVILTVVFRSFQFGSVSVRLTRLTETKPTKSEPNRTVIKPNRKKLYRTENRI